MSGNDFTRCPVCGDVTLDEPARCKCVPTVEELQEEVVAILPFIEQEHRSYISMVYGGDIAFEHRDGLKAGCIVCDFIRKHLKETP